MICNLGNEEPRFYVYTMEMGRVIDRATRGFAVRAREDAQAMAQETGLDGAQWLIEGRRGQTYHAIDRWSPRGTVHDLGSLFFDLAGPPLAGIDLY
jgi:hypothetical protein